MENSRLIEPLEIRDFSKKMSATYGFIRQNFASFSKCMLLIAGPPVVVGGIFMGDIFNRFMTASVSRASAGRYNGDQYDYFNSGMFWLQLLGVFIFLSIGGVITVAATYGYLRAYTAHKRIDIPLVEVWTNVRKSFWRQFGTMLFYLLISGLIILVIAVPVFFVVGFIAPAMWIVSVVLMIGFVVLTIYFTSNFFMIFICREMERSSFGESVERIRYLAKGKTWSTFGVTSINLYVQYGMSFILLVPWYIVQIITITHTRDYDYASAYSQQDGFLPIFNMVFIVLYFLFYILLYAIPMIGIAFQYFNLVELKESRGLMQQIEAFGTETESVTDEHY
jgi:hypothetical protein